MRGPNEQPGGLLIYGSQAQEYRQKLLARGVRRPIWAASEPDDVRPHLEQIEIFAGWGSPQSMLARMPRLRWVQWLGAGVDRVLDGRELAPSVVLTRVVGLYSAAMTEHVFAFALSIRHHLEEMRAAQKDHRWERLTARTLEGARLGVAGLGAIGGEIVRVGRTFGMEVWGLSRSGAQAGLVDRHFLPGERQAFCAGVDVLVSVLPATAETQSFFGAAEFAAMRKDAILINIGRGSALDEEALADALRRGRPGFAQIDVFRQEPRPARSPHWDLPNCLISAHSSGTNEGKAIDDYLYDNLQRYEAGEPLIGVVDRARGY